MKKCFVIAAAAAVLLSGCGANSGESGSSKSYNSVIRLQPEDESKLRECGEIAEARLIAEYPGLECKLSYKDRDSFIYIEFDRPEKWDNRTLDNLCKKGEVTFRKGKDTEKNSDGEDVPTGEIIITNSDIDTVTSTIVRNEEGKQDYAVVVTMFDAGKEKFAEATGELAGTDIPLSIWFDDELISTPTVQYQITDGTAMITGNLTAESSMAMAASIDSGALPCELKIYESKIGEGSK
ncbi:MAG: hypothetical protein K6G82_01885 [Ruminococcus sp.]|nr:hypothetical protein [Ruminococcus sp.]